MTAVSYLLGILILKKSTFCGTIDYSVFSCHQVSIEKNDSNNFGKIRFSAKCILFLLSPQNTQYPLSFSLIHIIIKKYRKNTIFAFPFVKV